MAPGGASAVWEIAWDLAAFGKRLPDPSHPHALPMLPPTLTALT